MNLHEYQAKQLLAEYGLPVSPAALISRVEDVAQACRQVGGKQWVMKVQVHAGGRGQAGGVKKVYSVSEAQEFARQWLGERMVGYQTDTQGQLVQSILLEACVDFNREIYVSVLVDRHRGQVMFIACAEGGVNIEQLAAQSPEKILQVGIDPVMGPLPYQGRTLGFKLGLNQQQAAVFSQIFVSMVKLFIQSDLAMLEVNPLVIGNDGSLYCLDGKIRVDANALYRQPQLLAMRDSTQEDPREVHAAKFDLNYVALNGNIGCMVNGAGLAMATMDMVSLYGGAPANFLDVGGSADKERVTEAFKIILSDQQVTAVLVNIFGGIVRCDVIAAGIIQAVAAVGVQVPVVVRLEGNNAAAGAQMLADSGLNIIPAKELADAAQLAANAAEGRQ